MGAVSCFCGDASNFVFEVDLGAEQHLVCMEVHQIGPFVMLLSDLLIDAVSCLLLRRHLVSGTTVMGVIFGCSQLFVAESASWCFVRLIDCWVLSEFFETALQC